MIQPVPATTSALQALRACIERVNRAAATISRAGLESAPASPVPPPGAAGEAAGDTPDLPAAFVEMLVAQRAFSAQLRVIETAESMADEAIRLGAPRR